MTEKMTMPDELGAESCSACDGCQWQYENSQGKWCYMFRSEPDQLPCAQHDKFKAERRVMGSMMVMGISEPND